MKISTFNRGIALLMAAFPDYKGMAGAEGRATQKVYWEFLKDFSDLDFERIVEVAIKTCKWFPKISELREELVRLEELRTGSTAAQEWDTLLRAAEAGKPRPDISPAAECALAVVGGYDQMQMTSYESLRFSFNKFESAYNGAKSQGAERLRIGGGQPEHVGQMVSGLISEGK